MSEEIKDRLEKEIARAVRIDSISLSVSVSDAQEALALITTLTAELTAARAEVERLRGAGRDAYMAGFAASCEGWNGEYPTEGGDPVAVGAQFDAWLAALTPAEGERG